MIFNSYKHRIASGSIALAMAAGTAWAAPSGESNKATPHVPHETTFQADVSTAKYVRSQ